MPAKGTAKDIFVLFWLQPGPGKAKTFRSKVCGAFARLYNAENSSDPEFSAFFILGRLFSRAVIMSLQEQIDKEYVEAYKAKDSLKLGVLRLLKTAVKNRLVELKRPHDTLADQEIMDVIIRQAKQRQDSIDQYTAAGRDDLAQKEAAELEILKQYLPAMLDAAELDAIIDAAISQTGASGPRDMGKVMALIMAEHKGQVDGKALSAQVGKKLAARG